MQLVLHYFVQSIDLRVNADGNILTKGIGSDGHDKPFRSTVITIIGNFKKALGDTDNQ